MSTTHHDFVVKHGLSLADDKNIKLGSSDEFKLYHTSSGNSIISETGGGSLYIDGTNIYLRNGTSTGEAMADFLSDGAVNLYYNNSPKLATTSSGVAITGGTSAGSFSFSSAPSYSGNSLGVYSSGTWLNTPSGTAGYLGVQGSAMLIWQLNAVKVPGSLGIGSSAFPSQKLTVTAGHIKLDAGYSLQWGDSHERIEQSDGHLEFFVNNGEQMTLDTNGLGIGITSPTARLDVRRGDASGKIAEFHQNTGYGIDIGSSQAVAYISSGYNQRLDFKTDPTTGQTERMSILANGNVGIGNTNPNKPLTITADSGANGMALRARSADDYSFIQFFNNAGTALRGQIYSKAAGDIGFTTGTDSSAGNDLYIKNGTGVGIGTSAPTMPLSVQAASNAYAISMHGRSDGYSELYGASNDGSTKYSFLQSHSAQTKLYTLVNTPLLFGTNSTERMRIDTSGNVEVRDGAMLRAYRGGNSAYAGLFMDAGEKLYIRNSWATKDIVMLRTGEVGIGTNSPNAALTIRGTGTSGSQKNTIAFGTTGWGNPTGPGTALDGAVKLALFEGGTQKVQIGMDANARLWLSSCGSGASGIDFYTGASNTDAPSRRLRIDQAGLASFYAGLNVTGRVGLNQTPLSNNFALQVTGMQSNGSDARVMYLKGAGTATSIGTTGPTLVLQNTNNTANNIVKLSFESASAGETVSINAINTNHTSHYGDMAFNTRGSAGYSEKMRIESNGNVGIGTPAPHHKLVVTDGATPYSSSYNLMQIKKNASNGNDNTSRAGLLIGNNSNAFTIAYGGTTDRLRFINGGNVEQLTLLNGGNVGVGTVAPKDKLHVQTSGGDGQAFGGKQLNLTTSFQTTAQLAITLGDHQGCYVKVFISGDWGSHSAISFLGEYFIQNGAGAYAEPGVIIREIDNTATVDSLSSQIVDSTDDTFQIQFKLNQTAGSTTAVGHLNYQIMGQFDTIA